MASAAGEQDLVSRICARDERAWQSCIATYEGRLQAFVKSRIHDAAVAEDLVQETFLGFLTALPNYQRETPLETFLFAIASHKIADTLRKQGRRPALKVSFGDDSQGSAVPMSRDRFASSLARSREQRAKEADVIADCLRSLIQQWFHRGEFERLKCAELLFVAGLPNKEVARQLSISEQDVANHKQFVLSKLKTAAGETFELTRFE